MASKARTASGAQRAIGKAGLAAIAAGAGTYNKTVSALAQQFPQLRGPELYAAASTAYAASGRAGRQASQTLARPLPLAGARVNPDQTENVRYSAKATWTNPNTGQQQSSGVIIDNTGPLSYAQIQAAVTAAMEERFQDNPDSPTYAGQNVPANFSVSITYTSIRS